MWTASCPRTSEVSVPSLTPTHKKVRHSKCRIRKSLRHQRPELKTEKGLDRKKIENDRKFTNERFFETIWRMRSFLSSESDFFSIFSFEWNYLLWRNVEGQCSHVYLTLFYSLTINLAQQLIPAGRAMIMGHSVDRFYYYYYIRK